jgi:hypothetical protein
LFGKQPPEYRFDWYTQPSTTDEKMENLAATGNKSSIVFNLQQARPVNNQTYQSASNFFCYHDSVGITEL